MAWFKDWPDLTDTQTVVLTLVLAAVFIFYPYKKK